MMIESMETPCFHAFFLAFYLTNWERIAYRVHYIYQFGCSYKKILGRTFLTIPFMKEIVYNNIVKIDNGVVALNEANEAYKAIFQARHT